MYKILADGTLLCTSQDEKTLVQNPVVTLEANKAGSFTFTLNPGHDFYGQIAKHDTVLTVERDNEIIFQGVAVKETKDFMGNLTYTCEGELTYLNDSIQRPHKYTNQTVRSLLEAYIAAHNTQVEAKKQFTVGDVDVTAGNTILRYTNYETTMKELQEDFIDNFGGYFSIRYEHGVKYLDYHATSQRTNTQVIELGKNLLTYSSNLDLTQVCTVLIPLGCRLDTQEVEGLDARLTIKSVNNDLDYLEGANVSTYGRITKVMTWDDVTVPSILKSKGQKYLEDEQFDNVVIQASAVDLSYVDTSTERFRLLDTVKIKSPIHGMDRYFLLSKQTINLNEPGKDIFQFGETQKATMTAKNAAATTAITDQLNKLPGEMSASVKAATDLITGAVGGYVVIEQNAQGEPEKILIMDNQTKELAHNVIQLNKNGIGFSTTGIAGPYTNAWTIDGKLNADFIKTGNLSADMITSGTLNASLIKTGRINATLIKDGEIDANLIKTGSINANLITSGTINADLIRTGHLSADLINTGTLNANLIKAGKIQSVNGKTEIDMTTGVAQLTNMIAKETFTHKDSNGITRTLIKHNQSQGTSLIFYGANGDADPNKYQAALWASPTYGGQLAFMNPQNYRTVYLSTGTNGGQLGLYDKTGVLGASLYCLQGYGGDLHLYNRNGTPGIICYTYTRGGILQVRNLDGALRGSLWVGGNDDGVLDICDTTGTATVSIAGQGGSVSCVTLTADQIRIRVPGGTYDLKTYIHGVVDGWIT